MKVVRRPLTADAVRFKNAEVFARTQGLKMDLEPGVSYRWPQEADWPPEPVILTREGVRNINDGDWIIHFGDPLNAPGPSPLVVSDEFFKTLVPPVATKKK